MNDAQKTWRIIYALEPEAVVILEVFQKKTEKTPKRVIESSRERVERFRRAMNEEEE